MSFKFNVKKQGVAGLLGLVALLLALPACGGGSSVGGADKGQSGAAAGPAQEVRVAMGDFYYDPGNITAKSGKVRFVLTNVGATAHRFSIKVGNSVIATSNNVGAGREAVLEVDLQPGAYVLGCTLGDHEARGSVGKLTIP
ncbi:MAG: cupredoxin domain-containing protein [Chloroflexi bacterium]|nr:cupredoxin domain-containing protein [Chloroflexota bacterium]